MIVLVAAVSFVVVAVESKAGWTRFTSASVWRW
jgi:hypothetical protein